jgi:hypothetical protein
MAACAKQAIFLLELVGLDLMATMSAAATAQIAVNADVGMHDRMRHMSRRAFDIAEGEPFVLEGCGSRTWTGARAQSVLMSVWRTCWQLGRSAVDFLSQLLRVGPGTPALPP